MLKRSDILHRQFLRRRRRLLTRLSMSCLVAIASGTLLLDAFKLAGHQWAQHLQLAQNPISHNLNLPTLKTSARQLLSSNGRPQLSPLPVAEEVWECEVVVVGGSLGGVAAASHAMQTGAQTCLIELTPWLGGQISSQGVSAIDESRAMRLLQNFSPNWKAFKTFILNEEIELPPWTNIPSPQPVKSVSECWVGSLCFPPQAGAKAAQEWLVNAASYSTGSRWSTSTAFKGAAFDPSGRTITAVYAVKRIPKSDQYIPQGRLSRELYSWYGWSSDDTFTKVPIRMQAPPGKRMIVIDATDTGELVGWANIPYYIGSDPKEVTQEPHAPQYGNTACTQAFTFPFVMAVLDDQGASLKRLNQIQPGYSRAEHRREYHLERFPMFHSGSMFNYRRIASVRLDRTITSPGDMTLINWNRGNDWTWIDTPLILDSMAIESAGQHENWMGGLSIEALKNAENHALLFAEWLIETQARPGLPLTLLYGPGGPMGTESGLSMVPYIREGRRIAGNAAYGQASFMILEPDLRVDMTGNRDFSPTAVALAHYDIDIHGCRYRNWDETNEASAASVKEHLARPLILPLEALIPKGVDNLLIGGKTIAVSHIVNAVTRVHYGEWSIGAAAGTTAGWLVKKAPADMRPVDIISAGQMGTLQQYLMAEGLRFTW